MFKKVSTLLLIAVFMVTAVGFAGVKKEKTDKVATESVVMSNEIAVTSAKFAKSTPSVVRVTATPADGIQLGMTDYDYGWNSGGPRLINYIDNGNKVHMTFMERDLAGAGTDNRRAQKYAFYDNANPSALVLGYPRPKATGASGFGGIDVIPAGDGAGIAVMAYHAPQFFAIDGSPGGASFTESAMPSGWTVAGASDPKPTASNDGSTIWYYDTKGRTEYNIGRSTDFGQTWTFVDTLIKKVNGSNYVQRGLDNKIMQAPNGDLYLVTTVRPTTSATLPPLGSGHPDTVDVIGYYKSTNNGTNWTWTTIGRDGQALVVAPGDTVYVLFENFGQYGASIDANNVLHVVSNGYTLKMINDTTTSNRFYTLYWKSGAGWKIISNPADGNKAEFDSSYYEAMYNGNGFAHPYPTLAVGGNSVFAAWSQPMFVDGKLDTNGGFLQYQIHYAYSNNGGTAWSTPTVLSNSVGGLFSSAAEKLVISGSNATAHMVYIKDTERGSTVFDGVGAAVPWIYRTVTFSTSTSVGNETMNPNAFELAQNFPNPFNPTTSIRYSIGKADNVSLTVYNMLGQEVATVVNQFQTAGTHTVNFDASNLASGMYLYKIQSGSFSEVKKMMLLK